MVRSESGPGNGQPRPHPSKPTLRPFCHGVKQNQAHPKAPGGSCVGGRAQQGTDQHGLEGCVLGVVSSDPGLSLGGPFGSPPPSPKGPAVFGSLGHHQRPVSDRWEGRRGHSALPACLTLGRTLLALPHLVSLQESHLIPCHRLCLQCADTL